MAAVERQLGADEPETEVGHRAILQSGRVRMGLKAVTRTWSLQGFIWGMLCG